MLFIRVYFAFWKWNKKLHFFHWNQKLFMFYCHLKLISSDVELVVQVSYWDNRADLSLPKFKKYLGICFSRPLVPLICSFPIKIYFLSFLRLWWNSCLIKQRCFDEVSESHSTLYGWCLSLSIINNFSLASLWYSHREFLSWISILSSTITVEKFILQRFKVIGT